MATPNPKQESKNATDRSLEPLATTSSNRNEVLNYGRVNTMQGLREIRIEDDMQGFTLDEICRLLKGQPELSIRQPLDFHKPAEQVPPAEWALTVDAAQGRREAHRRPAPQWHDSGWCSQVIHAGYTLFKTFCDYLVFPGCSLLLTTGEWLLGKTSTERWVLGITSGVPLGDLLSLFAPATGKRPLASSCAPGHDLPVLSPAQHKHC